MNENTQHTPDPEDEVSLFTGDGDGDGASVTCICGRTLYAEEFAGIDGTVSRWVHPY